MTDHWGGGGAVDRRRGGDDRRGGGESKTRWRPRQRVRLSEKSRGAAARPAL